jgi:hypothetical protein
MAMKNIEFYVTDDNIIVGIQCLIGKYVSVGL